MTSREDQSVQQDSENTSDEALTTSSDQEHTPWSQQPAREVVFSQVFPRQGSHAGKDCHNCGTELKGAYCHQCGQPSKSLIRNFPMMLWEWLEAAFDLDSRVFRSLGPLLFQPGRLSMEYIAGRRVRFVQPLRMYLLLSIAFFLLLGVQTNIADIKVTTGGDMQTARSEIQKKLEAPGLSEAKKKELKAALQDLDKLPIDSEQGKSGLRLGDKGDIHQWDPESDPITFSGMNKEQAIAFSRAIHDMGLKLEHAIMKDPKPLIKEFFSVLPQVMFVLLPLVAILLQLLYLFKHRYFIEHLVFAIHNHSFTYVMLMIMMGLSALRSVLPEAGNMAAFADWTLGALFTAIIVWMPIYYFLSLKRFYAQGFFLTSLKYILFSSIYFAMLTTAMLTAGILGLWLL